MKDLIDNPSGKVCLMFNRNYLLNKEPLGPPCVKPELHFRNTWLASCNIYRRFDILDFYLGSCAMLALPGNL